MISIDMDEDMNIYSNIEQTSKADTLSDRFDLPDRGVVPEKNTCRTNRSESSSAVLQVL